MNKNLATAAVFVLVAIVFIGGFVMTKIGYDNQYTTLVKEAEARQSVSQVTFDATWKIIAGQAEVASAERESFKNTFLEIMSARTQNDSNLIMKWSQEAQVNMSPDLFAKVQNSIESQSNTFLTAQKELIDIKREADTLKETFPGTMFLGGRKSIEVQLVTSAKTEETFATGQENDIKVFGN